jgi:type I restriction enzyme S subunit
MNAQRLIQLFDRLCETPVAIPRLRRFVLDLAIRGKLVAQDENDEPVFTLPIKEAGLLGIKTAIQKPLESSADSSKVTNVPFHIPDNWRWKSIGDCLDLINGRAFKPTEWLPAGLPIVRIQNLNNKHAAFNYCDDKIVDNRHLIDTNTFLISWSGTPGTSFGAFIWENGKAALNQHIFKCHPRDDIFYDKFLRVAINGRLDEMISNAHGGAGLQHITKKKLESLLLPVPPKNEQFRIVAKLDELTRILDDFEAEYTGREEKRDRVVVSALNNLTNVAESEKFRDNVRFYINHLPRLTTRPEHVHQLRQSILDLAVRGKLQPESPINLAYLDSSSKIVNDETSQETKVSWPFKLPTNWMWCTLDTIVDQITDGDHATPLRIHNSEVPLITAKNVRDGFFDYKKTDWVSYDTAKKSWVRCRPKVNDILLVCVGATIGRLAILREAKDMVLVRSVALIRPGGKINVDYLSVALRSPLGQQQMWEKVKATGQPCLYLNRIKSLQIPVPPLNEQSLIVSKVEELFKICNNLNEQILEMHVYSANLIEASLTTALNVSK